MLARIQRPSKRVDNYIFANAQEIVRAFCAQVRFESQPESIYIHFID